MEDKSNFYIVAIIGMVAIVALVVMVMNTKTSPLMTTPTTLVDTVGQAAKVVTKAVAPRVSQISPTDLLNRRLEYNSKYQSFSKSMNLEYKWTSSPNSPIAKDKWILAYYWTGTNLTPSEVDFNSFTHLSTDQIWPQSNGSINPVVTDLTIIPYAHQAGKKVLAEVYCYDFDVSCSGAILPMNRKRFVTNLVNYVRQNNYDGINLNAYFYSPSADLAQTVTMLRQEFDASSPRLLLTLSTWTIASNMLNASMYSKFDKIDIQTLDMSGAWDGWVTWFESPIYDGGYRFPNSNVLVPSITGFVNDAISRGIPPDKILVSVELLGMVWQGGLRPNMTNEGVTGPRQEWILLHNPTNYWVQYYTLAQNYNLSENGSTPTSYRWDDIAKAAYLSIDNPGSVSDQFVSYDDPVAIAAKAEYVQQMSLGGFAAYTLNGGYRANLPPGQRNLLMASVKSAADRYWNLEMGIK